MGNCVSRFFARPIWQAGVVSRVVIAAMLSAGFSMAEAQQPLAPKLPDLTGIINSATVDGKTGRDWAIVLGKALFWDMQAGSDGVAFASCHYNAGSDIRLSNQLSPGARDFTVGPGGDMQFGSTRSDTGAVAAGAMPSGAVAGANYTLKETDFPLYRLANESDRNSDIVTTTNDIVSSQGVFAAPFVSVSAVNGKESCGSAAADVFHVGTLAARQVALRNSSPTINAIFNQRTLWDGSANNMFNGVGTFGMRDIRGNPNKRLIVLNSSGQPELSFLQIADASLASQAVGPIVNTVEMSCSGRTLADVGRKLMATGLRPLLKQKIAKNDSVFAGLIDSTGKGLAVENNYVTLVKRAFDPKFWNTTSRFTITDGVLASTTSKTAYTQMENNWGMFWGVAVMLYESTLISNFSEFDGLLTSGVLSVRDTRTGPPFQCTANGPVDAQLLRGCQIFFQSRDPTTSPPGGGCNACHGGRDLFNNASRRSSQRFAPLVQLGTAMDAPGDSPGIQDLGFTNTGVRPVFTDLRNGGVDPYGNPLSYARQYSNFVKAMAAGESQDQAMQAHIFDPDLQTAIQTNTVVIQQATGVTILPSAKLNVDGAAKVPTMRNVALTPPYTSSGTFASLRQVLKSYNRETNRRDIQQAGDADAMGTACTGGDDTGTGVDGNQSHETLQQVPQNCHTNVPVGLGTMGLLDCDVEGSNCDPATDDISAVIRFLKSLTDRRVQCDQAPFDHPSLVLTLGHQSTDANGDGRADDIVFELPAAGNGGYDISSGFCIPNEGNLFAPGMQGRVGGTKAPLTN